MATNRPDDSKARLLDTESSSSQTEDAFVQGEESPPVTFLTQEIISYLGEGFVINMPIDLIESYCMRSIERDEPTGKILYTLMLNFLSAYSNPATSDEAMKAFDFLDYLATPPSQ